eukprot:m.172447 g.172447  ORF g.172447 m.172447 type:complete len:78 (-) comp31685_c8_seq2:2082-2315(-)
MLASASPVLFSFLFFFFFPFSSFSLFLFFSGFCFFDYHLVFMSILKLKSPISNLQSASLRPGNINHHDRDHDSQSRS